MRSGYSLRALGEELCEEAIFGFFLLLFLFFLLTAQLRQAALPAALTGAPAKILSSSRSILACSSCSASSRKASRA